MKNTEKENKKIIERMEFDDYAYAQQVRDEALEKLQKCKRARPIALFATLAYLVFLIVMNANEYVAIAILVVAFVAMVVSYRLSGGIKDMMEVAKKVAFAGWFICPFPIDIATGIVTLVYTPIILFIMPSIFVLITRVQAKRNIRDAEEYMSFCKPVEEIV